jgi:hypothetical protein
VIRVVERQKHVDFFDARKLLMTAFDAAKLILLVDVRGEDFRAKNGAFVA